MLKLISFDLLLTSAEYIHVWLVVIAWLHEIGSQRNVAAQERKPE